MDSHRAFAFPNEKWKLIYWSVWSGQRREERGQAKNTYCAIICTALLIKSNVFRFNETSKSSSFPFFQRCTFTSNVLCFVKIFWYPKCVHRKCFVYRVYCANNWEFGGILMDAHCCSGKTWNFDVKISAFQNFDYVKIQQRPTSNQRSLVNHSPKLIYSFQISHNPTTLMIKF